MLASPSLRSALLRRLLVAVGTALLAGPAGCAANITDAGGGGGNGSETTDTGNDSGSNTGSASAGCENTTSGTGGDLKQLTACFANPGTCPNEIDATRYIIPDSCAVLQSVDCGPTEGGGQCCYVITEQVVGCAGRPFVVDGLSRAARAVRGGQGWRADLAPPAVADLSAEERAALASAYARDALAEHASIASFSRFALDLLAHAAPAELVEAAHAAALDEIRHARLGFSLASAYAGEPIAPGRLDTAGSAPSPTLAELAAATAREGCIGETISALFVAEQLARATDPAVRAALSGIAEDEARHAELAWRTVAWALEVGGEDVRHAVTDVFREAAVHAPDAGDTLAPSHRPVVMAAHGRIGVNEARVLAQGALDDVVKPCAARLLGSAAARAALAS